VAFATTQFELRVAPLDGGPTRTLADQVAGVWDWRSDGFVYFQVSTPGGLARVPATGGSSEAVERLTALLEGELVHTYFSVLPGERMGVFTIMRDLSGEGHEVWAIDLETRERTFLTAGSTPRYASTGHLLFATPDGFLMAQPIEPATAELTGPAVPVAEGLSLIMGLADYAVSESGSLIYGVGGGGAVGDGLWEPVWVTRSGEAMPVDPSWRVNIGIVPGSGLRLSPDGARVAVKQLVDGNDDIWIKRLPDGPLDRLTSDDRVDTSPFWSANGEFVAYSRDDVSGNLDIWQRRADGTGSPQPVLEDERSLVQGRWSPDGEWMLFRTSTGPGASPDDDIVGFRPGVDSAAIPLVTSPEFSEQSPALSPNGRWLAYTSNRTGQREVYVRPFPNVDSTRITVSRAGGQNPLWAHSGTELFFVDGEGGLVAAEVEADSVFRVLRSETLFDATGYALFEGTDYHDIGPDDERFLMLRLAQGSGDTGGDSRFILVVNWFTELRDRMGGN